MAHWSPKPRRSPVTAGDQPAAVLDLLRHIDDNTKLAVDLHSPSSNERPFVPISVLRRYLADGKIRSILASSYMSSEISSQVRGEYLRIFTILVCIQKLPYLKHFLANPHLSDGHLPFFHDSDWPSETRSFFQAFSNAQWQFCAENLEPNKLNGYYNIDERVIVPIVRAHAVKKSPDSISTRIDVHPDYNYLVERNEQGAPSTNTFFLKSSATKASEIHHKEVKAYKILGQQKDVLPYFAQFHGSWIQGQYCNMLLEYVGGGTLSEFMENSETPVKGEHILRFWTGLSELAKPLMRIHALPLEGHTGLKGIHHDIKADNILVTERLGPSRFDVKFKLADLGLTDFDSFTKPSGDTMSKNNPGTQTYSPPELWRNEKDLYLQYTNQEARPSKDIWGFGCILSEAGVWVIQGKEGLQNYRSERAKATDAIEALRETSHSGCFHDGYKVLQTVADTHEEALRGRRQNDPITDKIFELVEDMLSDENSRPSASEVHSRFQTYLEKAGRRMQIPQIFSTPGFDRLQPPMTPPELGLNGLNIYDSPVSDSRLAQSREMIPPIGFSPLNHRYSNGYTTRMYQRWSNDGSQMMSQEIPESSNRLSTSTRSSHDTPERRSTHPLMRSTPEHVDPSSDSHRPTLMKPSSEPNGKAKHFESRSDPQSPLPDRQISNPRPNKSEGNGNTIRPPSVKIVQPRQEFPNASIEEVEKWIHRTQAFGNTPPLEGLDWVRSQRARDQIFLFDDSESMRRHWNDVIRAFMALGYIVKDKDPDGMEIRMTMDQSFRKRSKHRKPLHTALLAHHLGGQCDMSLTLGQILRELDVEGIQRNQGRRFLGRKAKVGVSIYVFTDGVWDEGDECVRAIAEPIKAIIKRGMRKGQLGITFVQFGSDPTGTVRLQDLDDKMADYGVEQDIIDTEPFDGNVFKMLLGSLYSTVDGRSTRPLSTPDFAHSRHTSVLSTSSRSSALAKEVGR